MQIFKEKPTHATNGTYTRCHHCDAPVTARFARVFGDNNDEVHGCPRCSTMKQLYAGEGALD